jgi:hypothetical protein
MNKSERSLPLPTRSGSREASGRRSVLFVLHQVADTLEKVETQLRGAQRNLVEVHHALEDAVLTQPATEL